MNIGDRVRLLREKKGMTQEELATQLGYKSKSSVTHIERGRDIPRSMVVKLADILNTTPAYLMGWDENKSEIPLISVENIIKRSRIESGLSQKELAEKIGKSLSLVQKYESGQIKPPKEVLEKISNTLNINVDVFYFIENIHQTTTNLNALTDIISKNSIYEAEDYFKKVIYFLEKFAHLNDKGKQKIIEYITDLSENSKYTK